MAEVPCINIFRIFVDRVGGRSGEIVLLNLSLAEVLREDGDVKGLR
jgi:hypothetical protein